MRTGLRNGLSAMDKMLNSFKRLAAMSAEVLYRFLPKVLDAVLDLMGYDILKKGNEESFERLEASRAEINRDFAIRQADDQMRTMREFSQGKLSFDDYAYKMSVAGIGVSKTAKESRALSKSSKLGLPSYLTRQDPTTRMQTPFADELKQSDTAAAASGYPAMSTQNDALNVTPLKTDDGAGSMALLNNEYPIVQKSFETAEDDGVLLTRLGNLRDKIYLLCDKKTKVNLNVGQTIIGEAVM